MRESLAALSTATANQKASKRGQCLNEHARCCRLNSDSSKFFSLFFLEKSHQIMHIPKLFPKYGRVTLEL
jgi:hypothetical protein